MIKYDVVEKKEILHELFAGLLADIDRLLEKYNISGSTDPLVIFQNKINIIWLDIMSKKYSTMEDMLQLKGIYLFAKEYIEELNQYNPSKADWLSAYPNSKTVKAMNDVNNKRNVVGPFDTVEDVMEALRL